MFDGQHLNARGSMRIAGVVVLVESIIENPIRQLLARGMY